MSNRWEEAVNVNRSIIQLFPNDGDSHNRLGKALMELGRYNEAKRAYKKALELDPMNQIAKKNLDRLNVLVKSKTAQAATVQVDPTLFIEETGKTAITVLQDMPKDILAALNAGDPLELKPEGNRIALETPNGDLVGYVEPKLTARLVKLISDGNQYAAGVASVSGDECRVIVKETYQDPSQAGRPSFPSAIATDGGLRPYTKGSLLRYDTRSEDAETEDTEEEESGDEDGTQADWDSETVAQEGHVRLNDAAAAEDVDEDDFDE
jgi:tetratricopeptide (TPR) repeat protein